MKCTAQQCAVVPCIPESSAVTEQPATTATGIASCLAGWRGPATPLPTRAPEARGSSRFRVHTTLGRTQRCKFPRTEFASRNLHTERRPSSNAAFMSTCMSIYRYSSRHRLFCSGANETDRFTIENFCAKTSSEKPTQIAKRPTPARLVRNVPGHGHGTACLLL
jgi:hypothetical protein